MLNMFSKNIADKSNGSIVANYNNGEPYTLNQTSFLQENIYSLRKFIHRTRDLDDAFSIMKNGLVVEESLEACVDDVALSREDINNSNVFNYRFGNYSLVVGVPRSNNVHIDSYLVSPDSISSIDHKNIINDVIDECDFDKPMVLLSKYIAGIANQNTGELIKNPNYSPLSSTDDDYSIGENSSASAKIINHKEAF